MTLAEEAPDYAERVAEFLKRSQARRVPWGNFVARGALVCKSTSVERARRSEMGETAIALLEALGVTASQLAAIDASYGIGPPAPAELLAALEAAQSAPEPAPAPVPAGPPPLELGR